MERTNSEILDSIEAKMDSILEIAERLSKRVDEYIEKME